jgi:hypothetical protein
MNKVISFLLSDFATKGLTKHILLPIMNIDIRVKHLLPFLEKYPELENLTTNSDKTLSICITERFYKIMSLDEYPTIFYQIIYQIL